MLLQFKTRHDGTTYEAQEITKDGVRDVEIQFIKATTLADGTQAITMRVDVKPTFQMDWQSEIFRIMGPPRTPRQPPVEAVPSEAPAPPPAVMCSPHLRRGTAEEPLRPLSAPDRRGVQRPGGGTGELHVEYVPWQ